MDDDKRLSRQLKATKLYYSVVKPIKLWIIINLYNDHLNNFLQLFNNPMLKR
jgi:hypothetical protein